MKPQSKTTLEWFEEARAVGHEWADAAIENCHQYGTADIDVESMPAALDTAFEWYQSVQGDDYWREIFESLLENP